MKISIALVGSYLTHRIDYNIFENDFECSYFEDYDILKLGDFHVYSVF